MALNPAEENTLRKFIKDHLAPPPPQTQSYKNMEILKVDPRVADDPALGRKEGALKVLDPNDDQEFARKVKHVLAPGEKLMEFVARTGMSRSAALASSRDEITRWNDMANERNKDLDIPHSDLRFPQGRQPASAPITLLP